MPRTSLPSEILQPGCHINKFASMDKISFRHPRDRIACFLPPESTPLAPGGCEDTRGEDSCRRQSGPWAGSAVNGCQPSRADTTGRPSGSHTPLLPCSRDSAVTHPSFYLVCPCHCSRLPVRVPGERRQADGFYGPLHHAGIEREHVLGLCLFTEKSLALWGDVYLSTDLMNPMACVVGDWRPGGG